ncbi:MAG TPA: response regulator [Stellaceae bacterium]|nr:response regulator [Stellaceae bacterium]
MPVDSAQQTILVVEDDPDVRDYASRVLEDCGYTVLTAADGAAALSMLRDGRRIDVLFTDIVMPGIDGIEVARRAVEQVPGLKVLFASGYTAGFGPVQHLLKKPYRPGQLANEIAAALNE